MVWLAPSPGCTGPDPGQETPSVKRCDDPNVFERLIDGTGLGPPSQPIPPRGHPTPSRAAAQFLSDEDEPNCWRSQPTACPLSPGGRRGCPGPALRQPSSAAGGSRVSVRDGPLAAHPRRRSCATTAYPRSTPASSRCWRSGRHATASTSEPTAPHADEHKPLDPHAPSTGIWPHGPRRAGHRPRPIPTKLRQHTATQAIQPGHALRRPSRELGHRSMTLNPRLCPDRQPGGADEYNAGHGTGRRSYKTGGGSGRNLRLSQTPADDRSERVRPGMLGNGCATRPANSLPD